jgi:hypothetical protein
MRGVKFSELFKAFNQIMGACFTLLVVISVLASCALTRTQATPQAFNAPAYQSGVNTQSALTSTQSSAPTQTGAITQSEAAVTATTVQASPAVSATQVASVQPAPVQAALESNGAGYSAEIAADQQVPVVEQVNGQVVEL